MDDAATDPDVKRLLGGRSLEAFATLTAAQKKATLRRSLVQKWPVYLEDDSGVDDEYTNTGIQEGYLLRQEYFVGTSALAKGLVDEARRLFYAENDFIVRLHWLGEFMVDRLQDGQTGVDIAPLVRRITVEVDLHSGHIDHHVYGKDDGVVDEEGFRERSGMGKLARWTQGKLRRLLEFTAAEQVTVALRGGGVADGSDLATHRTICDIASVVKELKERFGDKLHIVKQVDRDREVVKSQSITSYWTAPTAEARRRVWAGTARFEEMVQVEIADWAYEASRSGVSLL